MSLVQKYDEKRETWKDNEDDDQSFFKVLKSREF